MHLSVWTMEITEQRTSAMARGLVALAIISPLHHLTSSASIATTSFSRLSLSNPKFSFLSLFLRLSPPHRYFCKLSTTIDISSHRGAFAKRMAMAGLKPHHRIALGVSGGPDSMALCRLTAHWKASSSSVSDSNGFIDGLMAIIVDHGLRTESREEAETVSSRVSKLGISCEIATGDWSNGRPKQGHLQEAARDLRFRVFQEVCVKNQIGVLLIAHHADDQKTNQGIKFQLKMTKALSSIFFKGVTCLPGGPLSTTQVAGRLFQSGRRFSTKLPEDSDTHEDFRPTSKLENCGLSTKDIVEQDVKENPIMIYMKGVPDLPRCGFSSLAVRVLKEYNVPISARNILEDAELKNAVKVVSNWPTFPQVFIKGEFVGGSDIVLNMHQNGELKEMLKDVTVGQEKSE